MKKKAVFFDFDGVLTLVGHACLEICEDLAAQHDLPYEKLADTFHGYAKQMLYEPKKYDEIIDQLNADMGSQITTEGILEAVTKAKPNSPMLKLAQELRDQDVVTGIITDNNIERMEILDKPYGLSNFNPLIISAVIGSGKTHSEKIFTEALREAGVGAESSLFIDNSPQNLTIPTKLGIQTYFHDEELNNVSLFRQKLIDLGFLKQ